MSTIKSSSLFHFTQDLNSVKGILANGFRLSFCMEVYPEKIVIGLPMVCFCDIPLMRTYNHRLIYGNYMIGISKEKLREKWLLELNPVLYRSSIYMNKIINEAVEELKKHSEESKKIIDSISLEIFNKIDKKEKYSVYGNDKLEKTFIDNRNKVKFYESLIAYSKLYKEGKNTYYDESEWRIVGNNWGETEWIWTSCHEELDEFRKKENKRLWTARDIYYGISSINDITHIIVKEEKEIDSIISYIKDSDKIMGLELSNHDKDFLLTKITSLERIENDY